MSQLPVVFLPGASGYGDVYRSLLASSDAPQTSMIVDYPGLGEAPLRPDLETISDLYRSVVGALPERCHLVALSMGCVLALRAALEHSERIHHLVLIAASGGIDVLRLGGEDWRTGWTNRHPNAPRWFVDDYTDLGDRLQEITNRTLLLFGSADPIAPVAVGEYLHERLPHSTLNIIEGATHDIVEDHGPTLAKLMSAHFAI